jgi:Helix-turn-helix domain
VWATEHSRLHDDDVVTAADAAQIAQRSIRTIRRAYLSGKLLAHRDGNGRGVRIRYADLRAWLLAQPIRPAREQPASRPVARINVRKRPEGGAKTENLELLTAARERRGRAALVSGAGRPAGVRPPPRPA